MKKHVEVVVSGRVVGVGFRAGARNKARKLGLTGWVQNWHDNTVHLEVEGESKIIEEYLTWLKVGTFLSKVDDVRIRAGLVKHYDGFEIKRTSL